MSVTGTGRRALTMTRCVVEALGLRCVYGDTASIMWTLRKPKGVQVTIAQYVMCPLGEDPPDEELIKLMD